MPNNAVTRVTTYNNDTYNSNINNNDNNILSNDNTY